MQRFETAFDDVVLGCLSHGHTFQRHLSPSVAEPIWRWVHISTARLLLGKLRASMVDQIVLLSGLVEIAKHQFYRTKNDEVEGDHEGTTFAGAVEVIIHEREKLPGPYSHV